MTSNILLPNIIRFFGLLFFQVLILNNINLSSFINPYIYILFIFLLPITMPSWMLMPIGLVTGLAVDIFENTMGVHAAACVFIAFLRSYIIRALTPQGGYDIEDKPTLKSQGLKWILTYISLLTLSHHLFIFFLEVLSFSQILYILSKIIFSTSLSICLMLIYTYIFYPKKTN